MKVRLGTLRQFIAVVLQEVGANGAYPGQPYGRNVNSPDINSREQLGSMSAKAMDTVGDPDEMPDHLTEPVVKPEDCYGPVPPNSEKPYVTSDPLTRDTSPNPSGTIMRGPTRV